MVNCEWRMVNERSSGSLLFYYSLFTIHHSLTSDILNYTWLLKSRVGRNCVG
jgi:hypothetical protein